MLFFLGSALRTTIFAARLVVPPDFIEPAARSPTFKNDINPEDLPPPLKGSPKPRNLEKLAPVPEPYLNKRASRIHISMIPPEFTKSSLIDKIKHACGWGLLYASSDFFTSPLFSGSA